MEFEAVCLERFAVFCFGLCGFGVFGVSCFFFFFHFFCVLYVGFGGVKSLQSVPLRQDNL